MALEPDSHLKGTVDRLFSGFAPVYNEWHSKQSGIPTLGTLALPKTAEDCLHDDLYALGKVLSDLNPHHHRLDMNLLSEVLALVKRDRKGMPYEYLVETVDKEIGSSNAATFGTAAADLAIPDLLMIRVLKEWADGNAARKAAAKAVVDSLMEIVNDFVIHTGNISDKELTVFAVLEKKFAL